MAQGENYCRVIKDVCSACQLEDEDDKYSGKYCTISGEDVDELDDCPEQEVE